MGQIAPARTLLQFGYKERVFVHRIYPARGLCFGLGSPIQMITNIWHVGLERLVFWLTADTLNSYKISLLARLTH